MPPKDIAIELALHSVNKVHEKWIKRCKVEVSQKKKSIACETQSDGSQVSICQYGIERDSGDVSQRKGYSHTLENLHQWLAEERNQFR